MDELFAELMGTSGDQCDEKTLWKSDLYTSAKLIDVRARPVPPGIMCGADAD